MKNTEKEYVESYDKKGCLAMVFALLAMGLLLSLILNIALLIKLENICTSI